LEINRAWRWQAGIRVSGRLYLLDRQFASSLQWSVCRCPSVWPLRCEAIWHTDFGAKAPERYDERAYRRGDLLNKRLS
jgi:hypothetical protein